MPYTHTLKHFNELSAAEVYSFMRLRNEAFVVEQHCNYQDADNKDLYCHHLMMYDNKDLIAYARLVPAGLSYEEVSIGRVITSSKVRGTGAGKILMELAIGYCYDLFGDRIIRIGAQAYAKKFYELVGFTGTGILYDEDGIPHEQMIRDKRTPHAS